MDGRKPIDPNGETMSALSWPSHLLRETASRELSLIELLSSMVCTVSFHSLGKMLWTARVFRAVLLIIRVNYLAAGGGAERHRGLCETERAASRCLVTACV